MNAKKYDVSPCMEKASLLERFLVKKRPTELLYPNPRNDFARPEIGPHFGIINEYCMKMSSQGKGNAPYEIEPLIVEKMAGDGYMILDGHHRWAAAMMLGIEMLPVQIVNLTHEEDHLKMMEKSANTKRVTINFDHVLCTSEKHPEAEAKPNLFLCDFARIFKEQLRFGIVSLIRNLQRQGYDVWVYTNTYRSVEYIQLFFKAYNLKVDGIINGADRFRTEHKEQEYRKALSKKYDLAFHIENDGIFRALSAKKDYENYELDTTDYHWIDRVLEVIAEASAEMGLF